jgi:hypothetical protein
MSSIQIEDHVRVALESIAAAKGLSLSDYLAAVAASDSATALPPTQQSLADLIAPIIAEARINRAEPRMTPADAMQSEFDAAIVEKYRKQGFNL